MVSNKKYKEVLKERNLYQKYYFEEKGKVHSLQMKIASLKDEIIKYCDTNRELVNMVDEYRQKYLDEQHKRLELAEIVEKLEVTQGERSVEE